MMIKIGRKNLNLINYFRQKYFERKTKLLFYKNIVPLAHELNGGPIDNNWDIKEKSYWLNCDNNTFDLSLFEMNMNNDISDSSNFEKEIKLLLNNWNKYDKKNKVLIKPMIKILLLLKINYVKKKYGSPQKNLKVNQSQDSVSDVVYEMY